MSDNKKVPRKRGRKPKGGKIITITEKTINNNDNLSNIIVHLKCKNIENKIYDNVIPQPNSFSDNLKNIQEKKTNTKSLNDKLKQLQYKLHKNEINKTNSACFWCSYNFSNIPVCIPKFEINETYHVYGCFCSPECACAYLMSESIDSSIKFERYNLLNYLYSEVYEYKKNIKCAPNPYYLLDKYYGNLSIEEYRKLSTTNENLLIIDKPITRELPELHEDNKVISNFKYYNSINNNNNIFKAFTN